MGIFDRFKRPGPDLDALIGKCVTIKHRKESFSKRIDELVDSQVEAETAILEHLREREPHLCKSVQEALAQAGVDSEDRTRKVLCAMVCAMATASPVCGEEH